MPCLTPCSPWSETPLALQGFQIVSPGTIRLIKKYCSYVYIDVDKGEEFRPGLSQEDEGYSDAGGDDRQAARGQAKAKGKVPNAPLPPPRRTYQ